MLASISFSSNISNQSGTGAFNTSLPRALNVAGFSDSRNWRCWVKGTLQNSSPSVLFANAVLQGFKVWEGKE